MYDWHNIRSFDGNHWMVSVIWQCLLRTTALSPSSSCSAVNYLLSECSQQQVGCLGTAPGICKGRPQICLNQIRIHRKFKGTVKKLSWSLSVRTDNYYCLFTGEISALMTLLLLDLSLVVEDLPNKMRNFSTCVVDIEILFHIALELFMPYLWNLLGNQTRKFYQNNNRSYIYPNNN